MYSWNEKLNFINVKTHDKVLLSVLFFGSYMLLWRNPLFLPFGGLSRHGPDNLAFSIPCEEDWRRDYEAYFASVKK